MNIFGTVIVFLQLATTFCLNYDMVNLKDTYEQWCDKYGKDFDGDRFDIFVENHYFIKEHNNKGDNVTLSHNLFSDMKFDEFRNNYIGNKIEKVINFYEEEVDVSSLDETVDWSESDAVTSKTP